MEAHSIPTEFSSLVYTCEEDSENEMSTRDDVEIVEMQTLPRARKSLGFLTRKLQSKDRFKDTLARNCLRTSSGPENLQVSTPASVAGFTVKLVPKNPRDKLKSQLRSAVNAKKTLVAAESARPPQSSTYEEAEVFPAASSAKPKPRQHAKRQPKRQPKKRRGGRCKFIEDMAEVSEEDAEESELEEEGEVEDLIDDSEVIVDQCALAHKYLADVLASRTAAIEGSLKRKLPERPKTRKKKPPTPPKNTEWGRLLTETAVVVDGEETDCTELFKQSSELRAFTKQHPSTLVNSSEEFLELIEKPQPIRANHSLLNKAPPPSRGPLVDQYQGMLPTTLRKTHS